MKLAIFVVADGDSPTLPEWGMIMIGSVLMLAMLRHSRKT